MLAPRVTDQDIVVHIDEFRNFHDLIERLNLSSEALSTLNSLHRKILLAGRRSDDYLFAHTAQLYSERKRKDGEFLAGVLCHPEAAKKSMCSLCYTTRGLYVPVSHLGKFLEKKERGEFDFPNIVVDTLNLPNTDIVIFETNHSPLSAEFLSILYFNAIGLNMAVEFVERWIRAGLGLISHSGFAEVDPLFSKYVLAQGDFAYIDQGFFETFITIYAHATQVVGINDTYLAARQKRGRNDEDSVVVDSNLIDAEYETMAGALSEIQALEEITADVATDWGVTNDNIDNLFAIAEGWTRTMKQTVDGAKRGN